MNSSNLLSNILIITGAGRSGTTILKTVLSNHVQINSFKYEMNDVWKMYDPKLNHDRIYKYEISNKAIENIKSFFKKKTLFNNEKYIIEKTVANVMRLKFVSEVLPNSKIIYIERDGRAVANSASKRWGTKQSNLYYFEKFFELPLNARINIIRKKINFYSKFTTNKFQTWGALWPNFESDLNSRELIEICACQWLNSVKYAREDIQQIPKNRLFFVKYEQLVSEPNKIINKLLKFLDLKNYIQFDTYVKNIFDPSSIDKWKKELSPRDIKKINIIQKEYLDQLGYAE